jgi:hypothetical protein
VSLRWFLSVPPFPVPPCKGNGGTPLPPENSWGTLVEQGTSANRCGYVFDAALPVHVAPRVGVAAVIAVGPVVAGVVVDHVAASALCHSRAGQAMLGVASGWPQSWHGPSTPSIGPCNALPCGSSASYDSESPFIGRCNGFPCGSSGSYGPKSVVEPFEPLEPNETALWGPMERPHWCCFSAMPTYWRR